MAPIEVSFIEHVHTCRDMEYNRRSCEVVSFSRSETHLIGTWRLTRTEQFPLNLYIDYCPFCGEWLASDPRTAPPKEEALPRRDIWGIPLLCQACGHRWLFTFAEGSLLEAYIALEKANLSCPKCGNCSQDDKKRIIIEEKAPATIGTIVRQESGEKGAA